MISTWRSKALLVQMVSCTVAVALTTALCFVARELVGHHGAALALLTLMAVLAMLFDVVPVLVAATLSAFCLDFFFSPPAFTFHIGSTEDLLLFVFSFVIALVNAVLTGRIRAAEKRAQHKEQQERSNAFYNTVFNSLSHELRTPIATIVGSVDAMQDRSARLTDPQRAELLNTISEAGLRLDQQVEGLLSMSRLESGLLQPKLDWCDVNELVNDTINQSRPDRHTLLFSANAELPLFKLDRGLLQQVLQNLLRNAIVHTPAGTVVTVLAEQEGEGCALTVTDNGPGIEASERESIFGKFYRAPNSAPGGSGLGLSIVKGFAEAMGGAVQLVVGEGTGTRFVVRIPAETGSINTRSLE